MPDQVKIKFGPARYNSPKALRNQIDDAKREAIEESDAEAAGGNTYIDTLGETIITPVVPELKWLAPAVRNSLASSNIVNNATNRGRIFFTLFVVNSETTFDQIAFRVAVAESTTRVRFGIYNEVDGRPDTLLYEPGDVLMNVAGVYIRPFGTPITLAPGRYYIASVLQSSATTTGAMNGRTATGPVGHRWHDNPGSAMGDSSAVNPAFYTTATTYTSGSLPTNTNDGAILNVDIAGTGLSYFPAVALRSGSYPGALLDYSFTYIMTLSSPMGASGGPGSIVYFNDTTANQLAGIDLSTGLPVTPIGVPSGYTGNYVTRILNADGKLWVAGGTNYNTSPTQNSPLGVSYYDGSAWTTFSASNLVNQAFGAASQPSAYCGISPSPFTAVAANKIYVLLSYNAAANYKVAVVDSTGVVSTIDVPTAVTVSTTAGTVQVRDNHLWVYNAAAAAYYDGTTWSVYSPVTTTGGTSSAISSDGSLLVFGDVIKKLTPAGVLTTTVSAGWDSTWSTTTSYYGWSFSYAPSEILITRSTANGGSNDTNVTNYVYNTTTDTVSLAVQEPSRALWWNEIASASQFNGLWVVARNLDRVSPSNFRLQYMYTF